MYPEWAPGAVKRTRHTSTRPVPGGGPPVRLGPPGPPVARRQVLAPVPARRVPPVVLVGQREP